ncbi:hypothetical protein [Candidatus Enterococcus ikei]|uniref:Uncharacterized protein n=1 Tax=Candidatus Enterococcus ikei TaxID=2815326 RepID=A0ABS3GY77_9ENTE|nr:hypothetical protein [Enterococcus sp. DIV0869a]MBO0440216.1 hypothetical protein [Enterococcus sp. DIV0869a]
MYNSWRVTKYNPKYRNSKGVYLKDEWTSITDIGKEFNGVQLTMDMYLAIENAYTQIVLSAMSELKIETLRIKELEKIGFKEHYKNTENELESLYNSLKNDLIVSSSQISMLLKLILRETIWCKLVSENLFIHFGYDYYMYIGVKSSLPKTNQLIKKSGLYLENIESPYIED